MSDLTNKPEPHYGPVYAAATYPELAQIARSHGYALAVHGSLARDLDIIAIPWVENADEPQAVIDDILEKFAVNLIGEIGHKPHGRIAYTLSIGWGHCAIDIQFVPRTTTPDPTKQYTKCPDCDGERFMSEQDFWDNYTCPTCDGSGTIPNESNK